MWGELAPPTAPQERLCHGGADAFVQERAGGQPGGDRRAGAAGLPGAGAGGDRGPLRPRRRGAGGRRARPGGGHGGGGGLGVPPAPDGGALWVRDADRAVAIGGAAVAESYLDQGKLLAAAAEA